MKCYVFILCLCLATHYTYAVLSEKQLAATKKLVRNTCQGKSKAASELIDAMYKGDFSDDKTAQCYLYCILMTYKLLNKDNTFDWEGGIKAISANAPPSIAEPASVSAKNCKDAVKTREDKCIAATEIAKCIYDDNPSNYFLP